MDSDHMARGYNISQCDGSAEPMFLHTFVVSGRGQFPLDMLRYDQCRPANGDDCAKLQSDVREQRQIKMVSWQPRRLWEPTAGRWGSFLWSVVPPHLWNK